MSKLEAQSLAFCNRLQVYALCIENKLNGNVVNTPFKVKRLVFSHLIVV